MDRYQEAIRTGRFPFPYAETLGMRLMKVEPGYAELEMPLDERHRNTIGTVHGGVYASLADTALGIAHGSLLGEGEISTTVDLQITFLRPMTEGTLRAAGRAIRHGRNLTYLECDVTDAEGRLVARATSTCMTLRNRKAATEK